MHQTVRSLVTLNVACSLLFVSGGIDRIATAAPYHAPPSPKLSAYYLAIGDSLAYGITAPGVPPDPTCHSIDAPGYVCQFYRYLRQIAPAIQLKNLAVPEMDSCILVNGYGNGSPCSTAPPGGAVGSPLAAAVQFLKDHPGQVSPITVNVGGADLVPLLPAAVTDPAGTAARLPALFRALQTNFATALEQLRAAAGPDAEIIVATQYNPLGGIPAPPLTPGLPAIARGAINALNQALKGVAAKDDARVADVAAAFDANPQGAAVLTFVPTTLAGGDPSKIDIYPTPDGYTLYGQTVFRASGYRLPLKLDAVLRHAVVKRHGLETVKGATTIDASVTVTYRLPHGTTRHTVIMASNAGKYTLSFHVGKRVGAGTVRACASDPFSSSSKCSRKLSFRVR